ncbi:MAG: hypothetical protein AB4372_10725 [Xenococcus sp. (in: cyanobacteria)]
MKKLLTTILFLLAFCTKANAAAFTANFVSDNFGELGLMKLNIYDKDVIRNRGKETIFYDELTNSHLNFNYYGFDNLIFTEDNINSLAITFNDGELYGLNFEINFDGISPMWGDEIKNNLVVINDRFEESLTVKDWGDEIHNQDQGNIKFRTFSKVEKTQPVPEPNLTVAVIATAAAYRFKPKK